MEATQPTRLLEKVLEKDPHPKPMPAKELIKYLAKVSRELARNNWTLPEYVPPTRASTVVDMEAGHTKPPEQVFRDGAHLPPSEERDKKVAQFISRIQQVVTPNVPAVPYTRTNVPSGGHPGHTESTEITVALCATVICLVVLVIVLISVFIVHRRRRRGRTSHHLVSQESPVRAGRGRQTWAAWLRLPGAVTTEPVPSDAAYYYKTEDVGDCSSPLSPHSPTLRIEAPELVLIQNT